jgi:hypothetical protein
LCDYVAVAVNAHAQELFSHSHASQVQASPVQLAHSHVAALTNGLAQHEVVVSGDFAVDNFTALVAQPHEPHKHVSQVQTPRQFGHRQSTQPQPEAFAVSRFEFAKPKAPAQTNVAAARTAGIEKVFMVFLSMKMDRKRNESPNVSVRSVQFSHLQRRASNEGP